MSTKSRYMRKPILIREMSARFAGQEKMRGSFSGITTGSSVLVIGMGIFFLVTGLMLPSFQFYWNRKSHSVGIGASGYLGPGEGHIVELQGGIPPVIYDATVKATGPIEAELISYDEDIPSQFWGIQTQFSTRFMTKESVYVIVSNPSSSDMIAFDITAVALRGAGYPFPYLSGSLPYVVAMITVGAVLLGVGAVFLKRDMAFLFGLWKEKGFWTVLLMPALAILDAVITYTSIRSYGLFIEVNPVFVSLYLTGLWAVLLFHFALIVLASGFSLFSYALITKSWLPKTSKLAAVIFFSIVLGAASLPIFFPLIGMLGAVMPVLSQSGSVWFVLVIGSPIMLSTVFATYFSTIILGSRQATHIGQKASQAMK